MENEAEITLQAFREARQQRVDRLLAGEQNISPDVIARERDAICRHAQAVRAHAERLAKLGQ